MKITIEQISTKGDHVTDVPLTQLGSDGVFVTEIEHALRDGRIDLAVHSLKDLPTTQANGLCIVVTGPREDVRDVIVWSDSAWQEMQRVRDDEISQMKSVMFCHPERSEGSLAMGRQMLRGVYPERKRRAQHDMAGFDYEKSKSRQEDCPGSLFSTNLRLGTCSLRRTAQIRALQPGVEILPLRGNVDTRLRKLDAGDYDGIVLAAAGLHRLGMQERLSSRLCYLPVETMMPAPGQGALALEIRDEPEIQAIVAPIRDLATEAATRAERAFMRRLGAGCYLPVAAYGEIVGEVLKLQGLVISLDGQIQVRVCQSMSWTPGAAIELAEQLGVKLAEQALLQGAAEIIATIDIRRMGVQEHV